MNPPPERIATERSSLGSTQLQPPWTLPDSAVGLFFPAFPNFAVSTDGLHQFENPTPFASILWVFPDAFPSSRIKKADAETCKVRRLKRGF